MFYKRKSSVLGLDVSFDQSCNDHAKHGIGSIRHIEKGTVGSVGIPRIEAAGERRNRYIAYAHPSDTVAVIVGDEQRRSVGGQGKASRFLEERRPARRRIYAADTVASRVADVQSPAVALSRIRILPLEISEI